MGNKESITVLQVVPRLDAGGVERGVLEIAKALHDAGYQSIVCSAGGAMVPELEKLGTKHIVLPVDSKNPVEIFRNIKRLRRIIKQNDVNIIHARSRAPAWSSRFARLLTKCKFITTFHGTYGAKWWIKRLYNKSMLKSEKVIAISPFIFEHIRDTYSHNMQNVVVINRGVDLEEFAPEKMSKTRIKAAAGHLEIGAKTNKMVKFLLPARFTRWKGHAYLLEILRAMRNRNYVCYMVGLYTPDHDKYMRQIHELIKSYGLEDRVIIKQHYRDMPALYSVVDVVLSTSQEPEAFGRTIVEAQSMSKITVATEHGGAMYTIEHGNNGYFIPVADPMAAAAILDQILELDEAVAEEIKRNALRSVEMSYSTARMCDKTLKLYKQVTR
ncbi:MAG: glycosyltransferase family 4 protein [Proteobacteria bacterium]|nr:glycosyltransferase family 4 protein [Pseudomonadota bacterium]